MTFLNSASKIPLGALIAITVEILLLTSVITGNQFVVFRQ